MLLVPQITLFPTAYLLMLYYSYAKQAKMWKNKKMKKWKIMHGKFVFD